MRQIVKAPLRAYSPVFFFVGDTDLVVRDHYMPLDQVVAWQIIPAPPSAVGHREYRNGQHTFYLVPFKVDRLVQVTLSSGSTIAFSADDPEAVCDCLRTRCQNLA